MFTRLIRTSAVGAVAALAATALTAVPAATASPAPAAAPTEGTVDIRVELGFDGGPGPKVFEVTGVTPSVGVELTNLDVTSNPAGYGGWLAVDVQPRQHRIELIPDPGGWNFETVKVRISSTDIPRLSVVSDELFQADAPSPVERSITVGSDYVEVNWQTETSALLTGLAEFSYPATTRTRVTRLGRVAPGRSVRAAVKVTGAKPRVTGKVKLVMAKGKNTVQKSVRLTRKGTAATTFKRLTKGRWTLTATYRGDRHHLRSTVVRKIRLR